MDIQIQQGNVPTIHIQTLTGYNVVTSKKTSIAVINEDSTLPPGGNYLFDWVREFTIADLISNILPIDHGLDRRPAFISVTDNNGVAVMPTAITTINRQSIQVSLKGFQVTGTWRVRLA